MWQEESTVINLNKAMKLFISKQENNHLNVPAVCRIVNVKSHLISQSISSTKRLKSGKHRAPQVHDEKIVKNMTKWFHLPGRAYSCSTFYRLCMLSLCLRRLPEGSPFSYPWVGWLTGKSPFRLTAGANASSHPIEFPAREGLQPKETPRFRLSVANVICHHRVTKSPNPIIWGPPAQPRYNPISYHNLTAQSPALRLIESHCGRLTSDSDFVRCVMPLSYREDEESVCGRKFY
jgi:hypothetical protein